MGRVRISEEVIKQKITELGKTFISLETKNGNKRITRIIKCLCKNKHEIIVNYNNVVRNDKKIVCLKCLEDLKNQKRKKIKASKSTLYIKEKYISRARKIIQDKKGIFISIIYKDGTRKIKYKCINRHKCIAVYSQLNNTRVFLPCLHCNENISEETVRAIFKYLTKCSFRKKYPKWLTNDKTGRNLELDGYNSKLKLAFEYNGEQHYKEDNYFHRINKNENSFKERLYKDELKAKICKNRGVKLIVIPYTIKYENLYSHILDILDKEKFIDKTEFPEKIDYSILKIQTNNIKLLKKLDRLLTKKYKDWNLVTPLSKIISHGTDFTIACKENGHTWTGTFTNLKLGNQKPKCNSCKHIKKIKEKLKELTESSELTGTINTPFLDIIYRRSPIEIEYSDRKKYIGKVDNFLKHPYIIVEKEKKEKKEIKKRIKICHYGCTKCDLITNDKNEMITHINQKIQCNPKVKDDEKEIMTPLVLNANERSKLYYIENLEKIKKKAKQEKVGNKEKYDEILESRKKDKVECTNCDQTVRKDGLKEHMKSKYCQNFKATGPPKKKVWKKSYYKCKKCDYETNKKNDMRSHINRIVPCYETIKDDEKEILTPINVFNGIYYKCKCDYETKHKAIMRKHVNKKKSCQPNIKDHEEEILIQIKEKNNSIGA
jgi:hypothetical protein